MHYFSWKTGVIKIIMTLHTPQITILSRGKSFWGWPTTMVWNSPPQENNGKLQSFTHACFFHLKQSPELAPENQQKPIYICIEIIMQIVIIPENFPTAQHQKVCDECLMTASIKHRLYLWDAGQELSPSSFHLLMCTAFLAATVLGFWWECPGHQIARGPQWKTHSTDCRV